MKLNKLYIKNFRGASQPLILEFDAAKKITMLFGENGMGKSTLADALVCLCTDKLGSISDKSSIDKDFIRTLGTTPSQVELSLETSLGIISAKLNSTGSAFVKSPSAVLPTLRHLRRSQIINLIDSEPSKRYEALKDYIDVSNVIKCEDELRKASKSANKTLESLLSSIKNAESTLQNAWEAEGKPNDSFKYWAKFESEKETTKQQESLIQYRDVINRWRAVVSKRTDVQSSSNQYRTNKDVESAKLKAFEDFLKENSELNGTLLTVLLEVEKYMKGDLNIESCPVCERPEDKNKLITSISTRIASMKELKKLQDEYAAVKRIREQSEGTLKTLIESFIKELDLFLADVSKILEPTETILSIINELNDAESNNDKYKGLNKNISLFEQWVKKLQEEESKISKSINQHNLIKEHYKTSLLNTKKKAQAEHLASACIKALNIVESSRKQFLDDELLSISKEVETLYQKIHPDENLGGIKIFLKPGVKNSLELNADFYTSLSITPQSIYSESHLDTLGICIFMALAKKYSDGYTILILDDVVMSVDENHLDRFIDLLHEEAVNYAHILITTHYRPWKDRYRHSRAPSNQVHFAELRKWNLATGIRLQNSKIDIQELRTSLDSSYFDRQRISNLAGTILENLLDFVSIKYQCKLSRKVRQDYVLSELLNCLSSKLLKVMKVQHLVKNALGAYDDSLSIKEVELKPIIDVLKQLSAIRNQVGSHYNFDGSLVSDQDVEEFGSQVYDFALLLICPENGCFPDRNKSGSYHETKTGSIRLFPLVEPN